MRKITLKVKHILILMCCIIFMILMIPKALVYISDKIAEKNPDAANKLLKIYTSMSLTKAQRGEGLYKLAGIKPNNLNSIISSNGHFNPGGTQLIKKSDIDNAIECYKKVMELGEDNLYYERAYNGIIRLYYLNGNHKEAQSLIEEGINKKNYISLVASKHKIIYLLSERREQEAEDLGLKLLENNKEDMDLNIIVGYIYYFKGDKDKAKEYWTAQSNKGYNYEKAENYVSFWYSLVIPYNRRSNEDYEDKTIEGKGEVRGRVIVDGKPIAFALVWIDKDDSTIFDTWRLDGGRFAITNSQGEYVIKDVEAGIYVQGLYVPRHLLTDAVLQRSDYRYVNIRTGETTNKDYNFVKIFSLSPKGEVIPKDGKVKLAWPKVEGTSYYRLGYDMNMGGAIASRIFAENILKEELDLNYNDLLQAQMSRTISDEGKINPEYFIGPLPGQGINVYIEAYDKEGNLINSSKAHISNPKDITSIKEAPRELSEGEKLIAKGDYEEAFKYYEKSVSENPQNIKDAKVLLTIYSAGMIYDRDFKESKYRDVRKALELNNAIYDITKDRDYFIESLFKIETRSLEDLNVEEAKLLEKEYDKLKGEHIPYYYYFDIALNYRRLGKLEEASKMYGKALEENKYGKDMRFEGVLLRLYLEESWEEFLDSCNLSFYKIDKEALKANIKGMQLKFKSSEEYILYKKALEVLISPGERKEKKESFLQIYNKSTGDLRKVLKSIDKYYHYIGE
ncbi:carboxypeptidase regulatory-like domain-containing protein [Desnuesiella massiliensis]|uniref:carboxypeptidase regulatory-like domain-containing protein n=1 Tax=Desnuesiella massiliensis TaxID=1650662 RepID=UPI0006E38182|nr:carboxypeptidase regulatory-like domain-containing protein [Desnuesiella massiliensis]